MVSRVDTEPIAHPWRRHRARREPPISDRPPTRPARPPPHEQPHAPTQNRSRAGHHAERATTRTARQGGEVRLPRSVASALKSPAQPPCARRAIGMGSGSPKIPSLTAAKQNNTTKNPQSRAQTQSPRETPSGNWRMHALRSRATAPIVGEIFRNTIAHTKKRPPPLPQLAAKANNRQNLPHRPPFLPRLAVSCRTLPTLPIIGKVADGDDHLEIVVFDGALKRNLL